MLPARTLISVTRERLLRLFAERPFLADSELRNRNHLENHATIADARRRSWWIGQLSRAGRLCRFRCEDQYEMCGSRPPVAMCYLYLHGVPIFKQ